MVRLLTIHRSAATAKGRGLLLVLCLTLLAAVSAASPQVLAPDTRTDVQIPPASFDPGAQNSPPALGTKHVVVLVMDGARFDHTFGDPSHQWVPRLWGELAPQGTVIQRFFNNGHTITTSGHATLSTGRRERVLGEDLGQFSDLTVFEALREQRGLPKEATWLIVGKNKLLHVFSRSIGHRRYAPAIWGEETNDPRVAEELWRVLETHRPVLTVAAFPSADVRAHRGDWNGYIAAITGFDTIAAETWRRIQADPVLGGRTTLFITQDHGRQYDDWTRHGDDSEGSRRIPFVALGPDITVGAVSERERSLRDLGVTVSALLGVSIPGANGEVIEEILKPASLEAVEIAEELQAAKDALTPVP